MIFRVVQIERGVHPQYAFMTLSGDSLGEVTTIDNRISIKCSISYMKSKYTTLFSPQEALSKGAGLREAMKYRIFVGDKEIGYFVGDVKQTGKKVLGLFAKGYEFYRIHYSGLDYSCYEIGLGNQGHYFCLYDSNDSLIAVIQHDIDVTNRKDDYICYVDGEKYSVLVAIFAIYSDFARNPDIEIMGYSKEHKAVYSTDKELLAKYDPNFIPRIISRDGSEQ